MKIELLREKLKGIHGHDTATVRIWDVMACPFCNSINGFVDGCYAVMDYLKTGVLQCRADFRHAAWISGTGYANMVDLKFHESEILIHPTVVPADKLVEIMKMDKALKLHTHPEGVVFKANNPYHPDEGGKFVKISSNPNKVGLDESGSMPSKIQISPETMKKFKEAMKGYVYGPKMDVSMMMIDEQQDFLVKPGEVITVGGIGKGMAKAMVGTDEDVMTPALYEKIYGHSYTNPCLEVPLTSQTGIVKKVYPMPLMNPKSAWGKRMAEKLAQKS